MKKIAIAYFSATNVTRTYAEKMAAEIKAQNHEASLLDITSFASREEKLPIQEFDFFIFGFPVFVSFAPKVINQWIPTLNAEGKRAAQFFTYGARTAGYSHYHTKRLLEEEAGFKVMLSAEFLGRHSNNLAGWQIIPERPDEQDFSVAKEYIRVALERFLSKRLPAYQLQKPFEYTQAIKKLAEAKPSIERGWSHPIRITEECSMCRECETECPTSAFDADLGESAPDKCIECMRCVYICPEEVIKADERLKDVYEDFKRSWNLTEEMMRAKRSKIITEFWQTTC